MNTGPPRPKILESPGTQDAAEASHAPQVSANVSQKESSKSNTPHVRSLGVIRPRYHASPGRANDRGSSRGGVIINWATVGCNGWLDELRLFGTIPDHLGLPKTFRDSLEVRKGTSMGDSETAEFSEDCGLEARWH